MGPGEAGRVTKDFDANHCVCLEVDCPSYHEWLLSYKCGDERVKDVRMYGSFTREIIQTGSAEITLEAWQSSAASLRVSITVGGVPAAYGIVSVYGSETYGGRASCRYKPTSKLPGA